MEILELETNQEIDGVAMGFASILFSVEQGQPIMAMKGGPPPMIGGGVFF